uniref:Uncharacterized protein n=1 Tax=Romanomermis culicivorax TaxID=13658 RepID=A0A915IFL3_ROMCU
MVKSHGFSNNMIPDLVKSFVHPYEERTPSFDFLLTNHIFKDVNFRPIDYPAYFFAFFSSFIFIIPETKLEQDLRITRAYYQFMPDHTGLKCIFILHQLDENGAKLDKYSMQIRNVFFNRNYKKWQRGLSYDHYRELKDKLANTGIDIGSSEHNIEEYLIRPMEVYKDGTTTFESKKNFRVIVQKLKVHDAMIQTVAPDDYIMAGTSSKFTKLQQVIVDALIEDRKPIEDTVLAMEENQLNGNEYLDNVVKPFLMQIPEIYQMVSAFYDFKLPETRLSLCAFTHGVMAALSGRLRITPKVYHHIALIYDGQDLTNEDRLYLSLEPVFENAVDIQRMRTPIMISFAMRRQPFDQIPLDDMSAMSRIGVRNSLDNKRIMMLMNYAFGQGVIGTMINYPENRKFFTRTLLKMFDEISKNKFGSAAVLHNYVSQVINSILHTDVAYNVEKVHNYLSRYFLSMISIMQKNDDYATFVEKPTKTDEVNFVFKSKLKKTSILLKFVEKSMPMEITPSDTMDNFPSVEDGWDTLVITVEQHFEHGKNEFSFYEDDEIEDFVNRQVIFNYVKFANVKPEGEMILLNRLNLETYLDNSDNLRALMSTFFNKFSFLIRNEYHVRALFDGLLHKTAHTKLSQRFLDYQVAIPRGDIFRLFNFKKSHKKIPGNIIRQIEENFPGIGSKEILNVHVTDEGQVSIEEGIPQPPCTRLKRSNACVPYKRLPKIEDTNIYEKPSMKEVLGTIRTISGNVMAGFMIRDFIADLVRGDTSAAFRDGSFAVGSIFANGFAGYLESYGIKAMESGKTLLGAGLKTVNRNDTSLKVDIATESTFLALDAVESSIEVMELFGVIEGLSSITGPVGALLGALLITGSNIYETVHTVEYINSKVHLNFVEEIEVTLSAMMHLNPGQQILDFIKERDANEHIKKHAISFLQNQPQIKYFITEAASLINGVCLKENDTIIDLRNMEFFENSKANPSNETDFKLFCEIPDDTSQHKMVTRERKSLWQRISDGFENFLWDVKLLKDVLKGDLDWMIYDAMHLDPKDVTHSYVCHQSFGIENQNSTSNVAFFQLDTGYDKIQGFLDKSNIFNLSDGQKEIYGGDLNDIFIINGKNITGVLEGAGGTNQLYFSKFDPRGIIDITVKSGIFHN